MLITMSEKDIQRFKVLTDVREKRLRQVDAAIIFAYWRDEHRQLVERHNSTCDHILNSSSHRPK
ncbi:hypothetical protein BCT35_21755 [Vibrio lentus]|nr:hypothetical protein BCT75_06130 [Vibrio lentus]PMN29095.1 hypothetical protein BCT35_21755 [Vibrio lentus]